MGTILYTILIKPLELIFELIFSISHDIVPNPAVNLVIMSLAINLLVLPLYRRADIIQAEAKAKEATVRPMADHIKKHFKGDEKVMMLQILYEQKHYHPLSSLKSIISLLLQIPFFIAAYNFLSHLTLLDGQSMGPISDLAKPDGLITIGSISINLLPILMTVINIISSEIYTKGQPFKDKIVLYLSAAMFLVLLYDSPSGLVFYWTFNNVFALVKNLFYKLKNPGFILKIICGITGFIGVIACTLSIDMLDGGYLPFLLVLCAMLMVPMPLQILFKNRMNNQESNVSTKSDLLYLLAIAYIIILTGILIPSSVISASPEEFVLVTAPQNPVHYVINSMYLSIGFFAVWVSVYYYVLTPKWKNNISKIVGGIVGINTLNYFIFNAKTGIITADLSFDNSIAYDAKAVILQSLACLLVGGAFVLLVTRLPNIFKCLIIAGIISSLGMSIYNISIISSNYTVTSSRINALTEPEITLSKNGRNVVVIMMDWALSGMVPYIFEERPQLLEQYDGFTFYPNTVSFGGHTNLGVPALYGGYEYTPAKLNERSSELLVDKHNEALRVLPVLFSQHGIGTTVIDPPYSDYSEITNVNAYNGYNGIKACLAENYLMTDQELINEQRENARLRNFFLYGIVRVSPLCFNIVLYDEGTYNSLELNNEYLSFDFPQLYHNTCSSDGISPLFLSAYMVLKSMPDITNIVESGDQFLFIDNNTTHEPILLQEPDYVPKNSVDNNAYESQSSPRRAPDGSVIKLDTKEQMTHYHVNMAAYMALGEWFDYLRDNGVWDNTRIIIVSDHGRRLLQFDNMYYEDIDLDVEEVNPILFVKDYYSDGFKVSDAFMTNADVPTIATQGIIDNPINPFTGNPINSSEKNKGPMLIDLPDSWKLQDNMGYVFNKGHWYSVHDNIFDRNNWEYLGEY